jgi:hypothetical protein
MLKETNRMRRHLLHRFLLPVMALVFCLALPAWANDIPLFMNGQQDEKSLSRLATGSTAELPPALRWRSVELNPVIATIDGLEAGDNLVLDLFADRSYSARIDQVTMNVNGTVTVRGRIDGHPLGYILISTTEGRSLGSIRIPEKVERYIIQSGPDGNIHFLLDVDSEKLDVLEDAPPLIPPPPMATEAEKLARAGTSAPMSGGPFDPATVNVMVVYTAAARQWANSYGGGIANVISQAMGKASLALDNSNTFLSMPLVHSAAVNYVESLMEENIRQMYQ